MVQATRYASRLRHDTGKTSKKSDNTQSHDKLVRCPDCGCLTDNLGSHWALSCHGSEKKNVPSRSLPQK